MTMALVDVIQVSFPSYYQDEEALFGGTIPELILMFTQIRILPHGTALGTIIKVDAISS